jgi:hypothetical protein
VKHRTTVPDGSLPTLSEPSTEVKSYRYEEWIVPPGGTLTVIGSRGEAPGITAKLIGVGGVRTLARHSRILMAIGYGGGVLCLVTGVVLQILYGSSESDDYDYYG